MSAHSPERKMSDSCAIPTRRVLVNDASQLPIDYSSTPGGTIFSTTPGGSRIIYDRGFLMQMRNSPVARTPPKNLPVIPGVTVPGSSPNAKHTTSPVKQVVENGVVQTDAKPTPKPDGSSDEPMFAMDI
ncbi:eukaryotic translation initiation factor 4E-binding protein 1-like [Ornithodoros turicata]|uniref:eukaryotic translation initiation factor 4E-binding protein 1-like n=1 Tax=Ornithodoros turicata TaxID=34597 RepID=UPI0031397F2D